LKAKVIQEMVDTCSEGGSPGTDDGQLVRRITDRATEIHEVTACLEREAVEAAVKEFLK